MSNPDDESETPRTDEAAFVARDDKHGLIDVVHLAFAEGLEREIGILADALRECREDSIELLGERSWWQNEPRRAYAVEYEKLKTRIDSADKALAFLNRSNKH